MEFRFGNVPLFVIIVFAVSFAIGSPTTKTTQEAPESSEILPSKYVAHGSPAKVGQFPWTTFVEVYKYKTSNYGRCAGSLISDRHVLSAAHCFEDVLTLDDVIFSVGEYDLNQAGTDCVQNICIRNFVRKPKNIIVHPDFDNISFNNDIALLVLPERISLFDTIQTIALPTFDPDQDIYDGVSMEVAGWGRTEHDNLPDIQRFTEINLIPRRKCLKDAPELPQGLFCAGNPSARSECSGDSGGPLMMYLEDQKQYYLAGITSSSYKVRCGTRKFTFFTNVFKYLDFIHEAMQLDTKESSTIKVSNVNDLSDTEINTTDSSNINTSTNNVLTDTTDSSNTYTSKDVNDLVDTKSDTTDSFNIDTSTAINNL